MAAFPLNPFINLMDNGLTPTPGPMACPNRAGARDRNDRAVQLDEEIMRAYKKMAGWLLWESDPIPAPCRIFRRRLRNPPPPPHSLPPSSNPHLATLPPHKRSPTKQRESLHSASYPHDNFSPFFVCISNHPRFHPLSPVHNLRTQQPFREPPG